MLCRVAVTPAVTAALTKKGFTVNVEPGAGIEARFRNDDYAAAGGKLVDRLAVYNSGSSLVIFTSPMIFQMIIRNKFIIPNWFTIGFTCFISLDIVLKVRQPVDSEIDLLKENANLISFLYPAQNAALIEKMKEKKLTAFGSRKTRLTRF